MGIAIPTSHTGASGLSLGCIALSWSRRWQMKVWVSQFLHPARKPRWISNSWLWPVLVLAIADIWRVKRQIINHQSVSVCESAGMTDWLSNKSQKKKKKKSHEWWWAFDTAVKLSFGTPDPKTKCESSIPEHPSLSACSLPPCEAADDGRVQVPAPR